MENEEKLTVKQKKFIDYFIETGNATESARLAGYNAKTDKAMGNIGSENLEKLGPFIAKRMNEKQKERIASQDEVLEYLTKVMRGEEKDSFGLDASLQDRTKCAELLGKRYGTFKEKVDLTGKLPVVICDDITE
ncbi:MAG: terminase small subunit [Clostridia bacterium]|nr:terminase small subunit [Clostridia bacterium]